MKTSSFMPISMMFPKNEMKERVEDVLKFVDLYDRRNDLVKKFSGGMKRRLEVARGLIHQAEGPVP